MGTLDVKRIQALVEEAVDNGATSVEEIHQAVAAVPLEVLSQVAPLSDVAESAQELSTRSIGAVYDTIRRVNEQVGVMAERLLATRDELDASSE